MTNERIANILAKRCCAINSGDMDFAIQLFVEKVVCPYECYAYSIAEIEDMILRYLEGINK